MGLRDAAETSAATCAYRGVLALVEVDDALEVVIRRELAGANELRLVRLHARTDEEDRVDVVVRGEELQELRDRVARFGRGKIDRVAPAPTRRQQRVDRGEEVVGQREERQLGSRRARRR